MATARSIPAAGFAAARTLASRLAAKDAGAFPAVGCVHSACSGFHISRPALTLRAGCSTAVQVNARVKCTPAAPLRSPVRRRYFALCRERTHREMTINLKET